MIEIEAGIDLTKIKDRLTGDLAKKQRILDAMVLRDSNLFCPEDSSTLKKSAVINTVIGSGEIRWQTDYAAFQYYNWRGGKDSHNRNPRATSRWFETAKARYLKSWLGALNAEHS